MAGKWSNRNLHGALHFATGNFQDRVPVFTREASCHAYIDVIANKKQEWPFKLVAYVLMPDHFSPHRESARRPHSRVDESAEKFIGTGYRARGTRSVLQARPTQTQSVRAPGMAGKLQGPVALERLDDLAEDQLHPFQSSQSSWSSQQVITIGRVLGPLSSREGCPHRGRSIESGGGQKTSRSWPPVKKFVRWAGSVAGLVRQLRAGLRFP